MSVMLPPLPNKGDPAQVTVAYRSDIHQIPPADHLVIPREYQLPQRTRRL